MGRRVWRVAIMVDGEPIATRDFVGYDNCCECYWELVREWKWANGVDADEPLGTRVAPSMWCETVG